MAKIDSLCEQTPHTCRCAVVIFFKARGHSHTRIKYHSILQTKTSVPPPPSLLNHVTTTKPAQAADWMSEGPRYSFDPSLDICYLSVFLLERVRTRLAVRYRFNSRPRWRPGPKCVRVIRCFSRIHASDVLRRHTSISPALHDRGTGRSLKHGWLKKSDGVRLASNRSNNSDHLSRRSTFVAGRGSEIASFLLFELFQPNFFRSDMWIDVRG